jgi:hypothetical protein
MDLSIGCKGRQTEIIDLLATTFTASEGEDEDALISDLVRNLLGGIPGKDLFVFTAEEHGAIIGGIIFSRLTYGQDWRPVLVLTLVAAAGSGAWRRSTS